MKTYLALFATLLTFLLAAPSSRAEKGFDDTHRFIFYAVLEGCYADGLSNEDISQILLREKGYYSHFIYACPVCTPTVHALEAYHARPKQFASMKAPGSTFGPGLAPELQKQLYSAKPEDRLAAINTLMQGWIARRIAMLRLTDAERAELQKALEEKRKKGMDYLKGMESKPAEFQMSAFANVHQCAVCNGACGLTLKPDAAKKP